MALALVTGSSTGIGLATSISLARAGHTVVAAMRNLERSGEIRKIAEQEKLPIHLAKIDVDDDESVQKGFVKVVAEHGPIDILVNNAGIPGGGVVEETTLDLFRQVMETNFFGGLRCIKAVIPSMRERRRGTIVNVTSVAGRIAGASHGSYAASKWALEAVSESLAQELRPFNVRVAIVEPGVIATPIFTKAPAPTAESLYPFRKRLRATFAGLLGKPTPPSVVGDAIRDIVASESLRLRYPVGPDAELWLKARANKTDEQAVREGNETDAEFAVRMKRELGIDVKL
ncbi:MAG: SDR family oxidoreductase [Roseiarcus sp.]|uniref:SDR family oxidoreductase n=1 Tax=Roseiarcus sp. TaxID=1969460 RepID=UPI003C6187AC